MPSETSKTPAAAAGAGGGSEGHSKPSAFSFLFGGKRHGSGKKSKQQQQQQQQLSQPQSTNDLDSADNTASASAGLFGASLNIGANGSGLATNDMNAVNGSGVNGARALNGAAAVNGSGARLKLQTPGSASGSAARLKLQAPGLSSTSATAGGAGAGGAGFGVGPEQLPQQDAAVHLEHELLCQSASRLDMPTVTHEHRASLSDLSIESPRLPTFTSEAPTLGAGARLDDAASSAESASPAHEYELGAQPELRALEAAAAASSAPPDAGARATEASASGHVPAGGAPEVEEYEEAEEADKEVAEIVAAPLVAPALVALKPKLEAADTSASGGVSGARVDGNHTYSKEQYFQKIK